MADTTTTNLGATKMEIGSHTNTWGTVSNDNLDLIDAKLGGRTTINTTGGATTLSATEERVAVIKTAGVLVSDATINFNSGTGGSWEFHNACTGAFTVTAKVTGQTGVTIAAGEKAHLYYDGTDIAKVVTPSSTAAALALLVLPYIFPVGAIYAAQVSTNPATLLGFGTWVAYAAGKVVIGVDSGDTDFNAADKIGGEKTHALITAELAAHTHSDTFAVATAAAHTHTADAGANFLEAVASGGTFTAGAGTNVKIANDTASGGSHTHSLTGAVSSAGSGTAHNNLQPYITAYLWKRTA